MQCCCMRILLAKMLYPGPCSLIQRHNCWLFNLSGTVCWNQYPARWLVSVLSLRLHSTHCASLLEVKITGSILVRTLWTSSATGWGRTKLGQPFPLQRTDYLVVCFCRFVILFFFCFIITFVKVLLYYWYLGVYLCMKKVPYCSIYWYQLHPYRFFMPPPPPAGRVEALSSIFLAFYIKFIYCYDVCWWKFNRPMDGLLRWRHKNALVIGKWCYWNVWGYRGTTMC